MPTTPRARRPAQSKTQAAEHAFTSRVAQMLEPEGRDNGSGGVHAGHTARPAHLSAAEKSAAKKPKPSAAAPSPEKVSTFLDESLTPLSDAFGALQEQIRETAASFTDSRVSAARNLTALQQKVLENTQQNISDMIGHAQRMMRVSDMSEAFKLQAGYAQGALKTFASQADELRALSVKLARDASEPISDRINRTMERFRTTRNRS